MGMYDEITCHCLPDEKHREGDIFQTKDTPIQFMELYEIRKDGTLWHEDYDIEDRSDPNAEGLMALKGCMTRVNQKWEPCDFTGVINFYTFYSEDPEPVGWIEYSAKFLDGKLQNIKLIEKTIS